MASLMTLEVLTPDQYLMKRKDIAYVLLNTVTGGIGILANHGPLIAVLGEGTLKLQDGNNHVILLYVEGGFAEVKDNKVIILTPKAELAEHIDVKKWEAVRDEAAARLTRPGVLTDIEHTEKTLRRAEHGSRRQTSWGMSHPMNGKPNENQLSAACFARGGQPQWILSARWLQARWVN